MALSGIFLILFLIVHAGLNACIWANDGGVMFNKAAHFMGANVVPRVLEVGLFVFFLIHIIQGIVLEIQNRSKRGKGYAVKLGNRGSAWNSRAMGILGALVLIFLAVHLSDFWYPSRFGGLTNMYIDTATNQIVAAGTPGGKEYHDLYGEMQHQFTSYPWVIVLYEIGVIALFWHLVHGFQSSFRTLGLTSHKYIGLIKGTGIVYSVIICLAFMLMPLSFYFGWIQ